MPTSAQAADDSTAQTTVLPSFDVISVKPQATGDEGSSALWTDTSYRIRNVPLKEMISMAYDSELWLVSGAPAWADSTAWDIEAKVTDWKGQPLKTLSRQQRGKMMQQILKERFGLVVHTGTKILPVYEMTLLPGSTKLRESSSPLVKDEIQRGAAWNWRVGDGVLEAKSVTMQTITKIIGHELERVVVDKTGLKGSYECELHWTPEDSGPGSGVSTALGAPPTLFTALREQLGLKLSPAKEPVSILVVDHLERPSPN